MNIDATDTRQDSVQKLLNVIVLHGDLSFFRKLLA